MYINTNLTNICFYHISKVIFVTNWPKLPLTRPFLEMLRPLYFIRQFINVQLKNMAKEAGKDMFVWIWVIQPKMFIYKLIHWE